MGQKVPADTSPLGGGGDEALTKAGESRLTHRPRARAPPHQDVNAVSSGSSRPLQGHALGTLARGDTHSPQKQSSWCLESGNGFSLQRLIEFAAELALPLRGQYSLPVQFLSWMEVCSACLFLIV